jgi:hypothetical protein
VVIICLYHNEYLTSQQIFMKLRIGAIILELRPFNFTPSLRQHDEILKLVTADIFNAVTYPHRRHAVVLLVAALCYKLEGRGFESRWGGFFSNVPNPSRSRDSVVGIATSYGPDDRGVRVRVKNFLFSKSSRPPLRSTQPHIQWVPGLFPRG